MIIIIRKTANVLICSRHNVFSSRNWGLRSRTSNTIILIIIMIIIMMMMMIMIIIVVYVTDPINLTDQINWL